MQFKSFINKNYILLTLKGFTLIELIVSIMIMTVGFLGIMVLYMDVLKSYTQTQFVEEARFALSSQIEAISEDIKNASKIDVIPGFRTRIQIEDENAQTILYSCADNEGLLKTEQGAQSNDFYGNTIKQLFENNDVYKLEVKCDKFDCKNTLSSMGNEKKLRDNFYTLTAEFELTSETDPNFLKTYKFERNIFAQNMFSIPTDDE